MTILEKYNKEINGVFSTFDRIIIRAYIRSFFSTKAIHYFFHHKNIRFGDMHKYIKEVSNKIKDHALKMCREANRTFEYFPSPKKSKEEYAKKIIERDNIKEGLVCVLSSVEVCRSFVILRGVKEPEVKLGFRKCLHFYYYFIDKEFGLMHIRIQSWFPFPIQIYINGREYVCKELDKIGVEYKRYDNSITEISDISKAEKAAKKLVRKKWSSTFNKMAEKINPYLKEIKQVFGDDKGYYWYIHQAEYATDIMFKKKETLEKIYPVLIERASLCFSGHDIMKFTGRKLYGNYKGEIITDRKKREEGIRVKHWIKKNSIKIYNKSSVLRIETTINHPEEFKIYKEVTRKENKTKEWVGMTKGIANIYRYEEVSLASNMRYLNAFQDIEAQGDIIECIEKSVKPIIKNNRRYPAINILSKENELLFTAIQNGANFINGFKNKDIRDLLYPKIDKVEETKISRKITRMITKLRGHGIIMKILKTSRYKITNKGNKIITEILLFKKEGIRLFKIAA